MDRPLRASRHETDRCRHAPLPASGRGPDGMEDVGSGGFETKGIGLWIEAFGPERSVPWPAFVEAIEVRTSLGLETGMVFEDCVR